MKPSLFQTICKYYFPLIAVITFFILDPRVWKQTYMISKQYLITAAVGRHSSTVTITLTINSKFKMSSNQPCVILLSKVAEDTFIFFWRRDKILHLNYYQNMPRSIEKQSCFNTTHHSQKS